MEDSHSFRRTSQRNVERPHTLSFFSDDPSRLDDECGIDFEALDQLHGNDRHLSVQA